MGLLDWMLRKSYEREYRKKGITPPWMMAPPPPPPDADADELPAGEASMTDLAMMRRALGLAEKAAAEGEAPIGAIVYDSATGDVIAEAWNQREHHADPTGHAELIAIRAAAQKLGDWRLNNCTLVVTLEPCAMCAGLIVNARVGRLVYGARDPKAGAVASLYRLCSDKRLNHRLRPVAGIYEEESGELLRAFFKARRGKR